MKQLGYINNLHMNVKKNKHLTQLLIDIQCQGIFIDYCSVFLEIPNV